ncbi:unnamed protein product [Onchocerca flexuosa]|uniref:Transcriptional regulator n=1 Tax=Onchocerca flexuosa TaxID=387005 RepID=A0A183GXS4_9BILA|nr:unnamed protein product [Onchocerca flexuosa]
MGRKSQEKCFIQIPSGAIFAIPDYYLFSALGPPRSGLQRAVFDEVSTDGLVGQFFAVIENLPKFGLLIFCALILLQIVNRIN